MKWLFLIFVFPLSVFASTHTDSTVSTAKVLLASNKYRSYLLFQNRGTASIYLKLVSTISSTEGIEVVAGGSYEPVIAPKDAIYIKAASGTQAYTVMESNQ